MPLPRMNDYIVKPANRNFHSLVKYKNLAVTLKPYLTLFLALLDFRNKLGRICVELPDSK